MRSFAIAVATAKKKMIAKAMIVKELKTTMKKIAGMMRVIRLNNH